MRSFSIEASDQLEIVRMGKVYLFAMPQTRVHVNVCMSGRVFCCESITCAVNICIQFFSHSGCVFFFFKQTTIANMMTRMAAAAAPVAATVAATLFDSYVNVKQTQY